MTDMKIKPILFSTPMVQSILIDEKSQTRRIVKPQPEIDIESGYVFDGKYKRQYDNHNWKAFFIKDWSKYQIGDILWVRETWQKIEGDRFIYKADPIIWGGKWNPSIFMPKKATRIFLKVTNIRVERLCNISEEDAFAEGIPRGDLKELKWNRLYPDFLFKGPGGSACLTPEASYRSLWNHINGCGSFEKNPWVWVYEFERIEKP